MADALATERLRELERMRRNRALIGSTGAAPEDFAARHLEAKLASGWVTAKYVAEARHRLKVAVEFFGSDSQLDSINVADVERWMAGRGHVCRSRISDRTSGSVQPRP